MTFIIIAIAAVYTSKLSFDFAKGSGTHLALEFSGVGSHSHFLGLLGVMYTFCSGGLWMLAGIVAQRALLGL